LQRVGDGAGEPLEIVHSKCRAPGETGVRLSLLHTASLFGFALVAAADMSHDHLATVALADRHLAAAFVTMTPVWTVVVASAVDADPHVLCLHGRGEARGSD